MPEKQVIPKIIHFIWVGGKLREIQKAYLTKWQTNNPEFDIWLWYDSEHMFANDLRVAINTVYKDDPQAKEEAQVQASWGDNDKQLALLGKLLNKDVANLAQENLTVLKDLTPEGVEAKDIRAELSTFQNTFLYEMEMVNRGGNFGAASDIARVELLIKYGGIYSDIDLESLQPFRDNIKCQGRLALVGQWIGLSNALLASHPGSEFMKRMRACFQRGYKQLQTGDGAVSMDRYYEDMKTSTMRLTGPSLYTYRPALDQMASEELSRRKEKYLRERYFYQSKIYVDPDYLNVGDFEDKEMIFPQGYVNFETDEQKIHDWLENRN